VGSFEALINLESNSTQTSTNVEPLAKKQHKIYDATRKWQDNCVAQFAWVDSKMVDNILVSIKCIVCDIIIGWVKCIMFKHDNLEKHMGKQQTNHDIPSKGLKKNEIYYDKNKKHVRNLALFNV
jgi:hypothetical protein